MRERRKPHNNAPNKFRAWDIERKRMVTEDLYFVYHGAHVLFRFENTHEPDKPWLVESDTPLMQFTGLLDKNGKEIYEGDIVLNNDKNWQIEFKDCSWVLTAPDNQIGYWAGVENRHSE